MVDDEEEDFLPNSLILEQGERKLWYYYGSSRTGDTCTACFPFEVSTSQFITIPYAQGRGDSSKWFRGDGSLADLPGITHEQFQDGWARTSTSMAQASRSPTTIRATASR